MIGDSFRPSQDAPPVFGTKDTQPDQNGLRTVDQRDAVPHQLASAALFSSPKEPPKTVWDGPGPLKFLRTLAATGAMSMTLAALPAGQAASGGQEGRRELVCGFPLHIRWFDALSATTFHGTRGGRGGFGGCLFFLGLSRLIRSLRKEAKPPLVGIICCTSGFTLAVATRTFQAWSI